VEDINSHMESALTQEEQSAVDFWRRQSRIVWEKHGLSQGVGSNVSPICEELDVRFT